LAEAWGSPVLLEASATEFPRYGKDDAGNLHFVWERITDGSRAIRTNHVDATTGSLASESIELSERANTPGEVYDLDVAPDGEAVAVWRNENSIYASRYACE
jgi:hypothetical protein